MVALLLLIFAIFPKGYIILERLFYSFESIYFNYNFYEVLLIIISNLHLFLKNVKLWCENDFGNWKFQLSTINLSKNIGDNFFSLFFLGYYYLEDYYHFFLFGKILGLCLFGRLFLLGRQEYSKLKEIHYIWSILARSHWNIYVCDFFVHTWQERLKPQHHRKRTWYEILDLFPCLCLVE